MAFYCLLCLVAVLCLILLVSLINVFFRLLRPKNKKEEVRHEIIEVNGKRVYMSFTHGEGLGISEEKLNKMGLKIVGDKVVEMTDEEKEAYERESERQH